MMLLIAYVPRKAPRKESKDMNLPCNVGGFDRQLRIVIGTALIGASALPPILGKWKALSSETAGVAAAKSGGQ